MIYLVALFGFLFAAFRELSEHAKENGFKGYPKWWNTDESWTNKHRWQPSWAFKTFLVWTTDAEHFFQMMSFLSAIAAVYTGEGWQAALAFFLGAQTAGALKPLTNLR